MSPNLFMFLALICVAVAGCDTPDARLDPGSAEATHDPSADSTEHNHPPDGVVPSDRDVNEVTLNGHVIAYPKSLKRMGISMINNALKVEFDNFTFEVRDSTIFVDQDDFGTVSAGDKVQIGLNGEIAVNGELRRPRAGN